MKTIAINRLNMISMTKGSGWSQTQKLVFMAELNKLGYRVTNPELLNEMSPSFLYDYKHLMQVLKSKKGANVDYVPLFAGFPNEVPNKQAYFLKRMIGYLENAWGDLSSVESLNNGVKIPAWLFNIKDFGADPITQMQSEELYKACLKVNHDKKTDSHTEWIDLKLIGDDQLEGELVKYMQNLLYAKSSIKEELHADLIQLLDFFGVEKVEFKNVIFKETKAFVMHWLWNNEAYEVLKQIIHNPVDLLRLFAALTSTDVSLTDKIKFPKLKRKERRAVLDILNNCSELGEAFKAYRGLWLELGRYLHPAEYASKYPVVAKVYDQLRNGTLVTYAAITEKHIEAGAVADLLAHLKTKPGVFGRKIHEILRKFPHQTASILFEFETVALQMEVKNLLILNTYFETINELEYRTVVNKKGKIKVLENNAYHGMKGSSLTQVLSIITGAIEQKLQAKTGWKGQKIWIDPELQNYTVPLQQRKASDGIISVGRGSKLNVSFDKVMRLFVYWKEADRTTDLDLSIIQYDKDWKYAGHVSYTNLQDDGIIHSGDIQSAPYGAAEFIDISLTAIPDNVRYLVPQVYKYAGNNFLDMECHAGWMFREKVDASIKAFDAKTVANKFDLNGKGAYALPFFVDMEAQQIVMTDLYVNGKVMHNNVEGAESDVSLLCSELSKFVHTKPNIFELANVNASFRGGVRVENKSDADISFGIKECTYNASDVEKILTELI